MTLASLTAPSTRGRLHTLLWTTLRATGDSLHPDMQLEAVLLCQHPSAVSQVGASFHNLHGSF